MRLSTAWSALVLTSAIACGPSQSDLVVRGGLECSYHGPSEVEAGMHDVILFPEGILFFEVEIRSLDHTTFEDVVAHYQSDDSRFDPPNTTMFVRFMGGDTERGVKRSTQLLAGEYAVLCSEVSEFGQRRSSVSSYQLTVNGE